MVAGARSLRWLVVVTLAMGCGGGDETLAPDGNSPDGPSGQDSGDPIDAPNLGLYGTCATIADQVGGSQWNSCEPGCDGTNPSYLYCDDFDDGQWAETDGDGYVRGQRVTTSPGTLPGNDGWSLTIYVPGEHQFGAAYGPNPEEVEGRRYARCGAQGVGRSDCAATSTYNDTTSKMMGQRGFPEDACYDEIFVRYYVKPLAGYVHGHEKSWVSLQDERRAGIWTGNFHHPFGSDELAWQPQGASETWRYQNMNGAPSPLVAGEWNFIELHYKLNTPGQPDGTIELWADACGADGRACTGTPTLKMQHTNVTMREAGDTGRICSLWYENWSNNPSVGEKYYDQLVVATAGPIGFCSSCTAAR